jgi:hypothetical protein
VGEKLQRVIGYVDHHDETVTDPHVMLRNVGNQWPLWFRTELRIRAWLWRRLA